MMRKIFLALTVAAVVSGTGGAAFAADTIYMGGDILTMAGPEPEYVEALVVDDGKISFVGPLTEAMALQTPDTRIVDLGGRTMLPGFIDGHGHMIYYGKNMIDADLVGVKSIPELIERMKVHAAQTGPDDWIVGFGYLVPMLEEYRNVTAVIDTSFRIESRMRWNQRRTEQTDLNPATHQS